MLASGRPGEIDYYEELGVAATASPEEIRNAFRALARLLHPDQHTDPQLKSVAEAQMRKLNRIYSVLSDPHRRRDYDEFLEEEDSPPAAEVGSFSSDAGKRRLGRAAWAGGILFGLGLLIWFTTENTPSPQNRTFQESQSAQSTPAPTPPEPSPMVRDQALIASLRSDLRAVTTERDAAIRELARLREVQRPADSGDSVPAEPAEVRLPAVALTELPLPARFPLPVPSAQRAEKPAVNHKLVGFWFYAPPAEGQKNKNQSLYPPEYIEASISEQNGMIYGKYRARFRIVDRTISPDVNFTFTGNSTNAQQATFPWTGAAGARGEVTLRFVSENSLRVDWSTTQSGTQQGLDAGTAVLRRRIE